ncbi:MAG TPA: N-acetylmuramoyl-L-alanine amidase [Bacillota bacterium]|nr:N-acetylmuramoyl-L-alanine amidase [Bacillota bacterium]
MIFPRKISLVVIPTYTWPLLILLVLFTTAAVSLFPPARLVSLYYGHPLKGVTVAIDPGHGGIDSGVHFESVILEKEIVLEMGLELRRLLEQAGARVMLTRDQDEDLSQYYLDDNLARHRRDVRGRVKLINASSADLLISLHINSIYDPSVRGPIAFYAGGKPESKRLARAIHNQINPLFSADAKPGQLVHQQPQESNAYYILNQTTMPGILLEIAFMTNPDDRRLLKNKSFRKKMVQKIFLGVVEYSYGQEANEKDLSE